MPTRMSRDEGMAPGTICRDGGDRRGVTRFHHLGIDIESLFKLVFSQKILRFVFIFKLVFSCI